MADNVFYPRTATNTHQMFTKNHRLPPFTTKIRSPATRKAKNIVRATGRNF
jgi:hypothetical protein